MPGAGNPQALNRYGYVFNNPLRYTDPSGHDPFEDGTWWTEYCQYSACGDAPTDFDRQTYLFSLTNSGLVSKGAKWNEQDWQAFWGMGRDYVFSWNTSQHAHRGRLTLDDFVAQIRRLASHYTDDEVDQFVRAIGLLYAGLSYENYGGTVDAIIQGIGQDAPRVQVPGCTDPNSDCPWLHNMSHDWHWLLRQDEGQEQTHHYAGHLWSTFYLGLTVNNAGTVLREAFQGMDVTDVALGWVAGSHGHGLYTRLIHPSQLADFIARDLR